MQLRDKASRLIADLRAASPCWGSPSTYSLLPRMASVILLGQQGCDGWAQVPQGATPRSMSVQLRGELTRSMKPGSAVTVAGIFLPEPYTGFRAMRAGLLTSTHLEAQKVTHMKASYQEYSQDTELQAKIEVCASMH